MNGEDLKYVGSMRICVLSWMALTVTRVVLYGLRQNGLEGSVQWVPLGLWHEDVVDSNRRYNGFSMNRKIVQELLFRLK